MRLGICVINDSINDGSVVNDSIIDGSVINDSVSNGPIIYIYNQSFI
jgi:hypothetical protein